MSVAPTIGMGQTWGCTQFQQIRYGYGSHGGYGSSFKIPWRSALGQKIEALRQTKVKICIYIIHCILYIYNVYIYIIYIIHLPGIFKAYQDMTYTQTDQWCWYYQFCQPSLTARPKTSATWVCTGVPSVPARLAGLFQKSCIVLATHGKNRIKRCDGPPMEHL